jgi:hypothetical protein
MRFASIAVMSAFATISMVSIGYAQDQRPIVEATPAPAPYSTFWPTPAQETAIPYRPCNTNVVLANGRHACLDR